jgi:hypothetical protein
MGKAKTSRAKTKPTKWKQCERKGCRKRAKPGVGLCAIHDKEVHEAAYPIDGVVKISELRAYKFAALDAELRNAAQATKILDLEMERLQRQYHAKKQEQQQIVASKKGEYTQLVQAIADELGLDPAQMTIDPDSQIVRDLRKV